MFWCLFLDVVYAMCHKVLFESFVYIATKATLQVV